MENVKKIANDSTLSLDNKIMRIAARCCWGATKATIRDYARIIAQSSNERVTIKSVAHAIDAAIAHVDALRVTRRARRTNRDATPLQVHINNCCTVEKRAEAKLLEWARYSDVAWTTKVGFELTVQRGSEADISRRYRTVWQRVGSRSYPRDCPVYTVTTAPGAIAANARERANGGDRFFVNSDHYVTMSGNRRIGLVRA